MNLEKKCYFISRNDTNRQSIYLDNAATTEVDKHALATALPYLDTRYENPSSLYRSSQEVHDVIEQARKDIADYIGAKENEIYFTSGGSEGNCWAIQGFINYWLKYRCKPIIITSEIEHKSIIECVKNSNAEHYFLPVDKYGFVDMVVLSDLLKKIDKEDVKCEAKILVSIQYANNEIGTVQPIEEISEIVHQYDYDAWLHVDGVQAVGKIPIDVEELGIDMLSASAHKFGGLKGSGFLYINDRTNILPLIYGTQNNGMRGGTENVAGIVAMATALKECDTSTAYQSQMATLKMKLRDSIKGLPYHFKFINADIGYDAMPNILTVTILENVTAEAVLYMLDSADIQISSGSACNARSHKPSYVLSAIGLSDWDAVRTIRISFDKPLTNEDIDRFISELEKSIKILIS